MRTKLTNFRDATSHKDYDILVFVETWLSSNIFDGEVIDLNLYQLFRKDRDPVKTGLARGGGVLIAVRRELRAAVIPLPYGDTLLDQLGVTVSQCSKSILLCVSYLPPRSSPLLYSLHVDNILYVSSNVMPESCTVGTSTLAFDSCSSSKVLLDSLNSELVALRLNNSSLCQTVESLSDDNARLSEKVTDLQLSLASLQRDLPVLLEEMLSKFKQSFNTHAFNKILEGDLTHTLPSHSSQSKSVLVDSYDESAQSSSAVLSMQQSYAAVSRVTYFIVRKIYYS